MEKYNGWTNYATWRVNLEIFDGAEQDGPSPEYLQEYVEEIIESTTEDGIARDYAMAFISDVNWHEIAEHLVPEDEDEDEDEDSKTLAEV